MGELRELGPRIQQASFDQRKAKEFEVKERVEQLYVDIGELVIDLKRVEIAYRQEFAKIQDRLKGSSRPNLESLKTEEEVALLDDRANTLTSNKKEEIQRKIESISRKMIEFLEAPYVGNSKMEKRLATVASKMSLVLDSIQNQGSALDFCLSVLKSASPVCDQVAQNGGFDHLCKVGQEKNFFVLSTALSSFKRNRNGNYVSSKKTQRNFSSSGAQMQDPLGDMIHDSDRHLIASEAVNELQSHGFDLQAKRLNKVIPPVSELMPS